MSALPDLVESRSAEHDKRNANGHVPAVPPHILPSNAFKRRSRLLIVAGVAYLILSVWAGFEPLMLFTEFEHVANLANEMVPPNLPMIWETPVLLVSSFSTVSMAFLGTLIGGLIAVACSFFAAKNVVPNNVARGSARLGMVLQRVTPTIIVLLVLQTIFGVGPFSGMISIAIGSFGMFGKLFADAIEHVDQGPLDAVACTGATKFQMVRYGIIPEVIPSFVANGFYAFDINMRAAIGLGMFGGGGLGYELYKAGRTLNYKDQLALILVIVLMISLMERVSDYVRRRIIHTSEI